MTLKEPHSVVSVGVDWLTATAYRTRRHERFHKLGKQLLEQAEARGNDVSVWKAQGYRGTKAGGVRQALRHDTHIIQLSSDDARESWKDVAALATNISRLDLQVTFEFERARPEFFHEQHERAKSGMTGRGRKRNLTFITSRLTGDSLYFGQRTSDVYGRCYDKGMESKSCERGKMVRQELETKRDAARDLAARLIQVEDERAEVGAFVCSYMARQSLLTPANFDLDRESARARQTSDADRRMRWLARGVAPCVRLLLDAGRIEDVLTALGLMDAARDFFNKQSKGDH